MKTYVNELRELNLYRPEDVWTAVEFLGELTGKYEAVNTYVAIEGANRESIENLIYYYFALHDWAQLLETLEEEGFFE